uniref:Poly(A) RNA polymerase mitochondrial-like central palm domain-containing protein n=1 Tax=Tetranychus urticae TaxID=32264 RepID=T1KIT4_TETUR
MVFTPQFTLLTCSRLSGLSMNTTNRLLTRSCFQLAMVKNKHQNHLNYLNRKDSTTSYIYQHTYSSYQEMIAKEKQNAKSYMLIEDLTSKLKIDSKSNIESILDTPVTNYWEYWIGNKHYFLVSLTDYPSFEKKSETILPEAKFPMSLRIYQITKLPSTKVSNESNKMSTKRWDLRMHRQSVKSANLLDGNDNLDENIRQFTYNISQSELECKLKFFVINAFEEFFCQGVFNAFHLVPFGSSVNSLGWGSSGLDLCLTTKYQPLPSSILVPSAGDLLDGTIKRQRCIKTYHNMMKSGLIPGVNNVSQPNNNTCQVYSYLTANDVTITCTDPATLEFFKISEILFEITRADERVLHLIHFCKLWAEFQGILSRTFNNLILTMLIINYLQIRRPFPILPPLEQFFSEPEIRMDKNMIQDTKSSFNDVLLGFFRHLGTFDFSHSGINIFLGKCIRKPTRDVLFVLDPAKGSNMSTKVSKNELDNITKVGLKSYKLLASGCSLQTLLKPIALDTYKKTTLV